MKRFISLFLVVLVGSVLFSPHNSLAQKKIKKEQSIMSAEGLKWEEVPNTGGVKRAVLWGNPEKGPYGAFYKFPIGAKFPMHYHTNAIKTVVISGTMFYTPEGGTETKLGPGSYLSYGAKDHHASGAVEGSECTFFCEQPGKFDLVPVEMKKDEMIKK